MKRVGNNSDWLKKLRPVEQHALQFQSALEDGDVVRQDFWNTPDCPQFATARATARTRGFRNRAAVATSNPGAQHGHPVDKERQILLGGAAVHQSRRRRVLSLPRSRSRRLHSSLWYCDAATARQQRRRKSHAGVERSEKTTEPLSRDDRVIGDGKCHRLSSCHDGYLNSCDDLRHAGVVF
jgi:hypothetical protein